VLQRLSDFEIKLENFEMSLEDTYQKSEALSLNLNQSLMELMTLKDQFQKVSESVETLRISFTNIEDSVKRAERKSNIGLVLGIVAGCLGIGLLSYQVFGGN